MRVVIVTEYADSNSNSTGFYWNRISIGISRDHEVITICTDLDDVRDCITFRKSQSKTSLLLGSKISFFISSVFQILKLKKETDLFIISSNPFFLPLLVLMLYGKKKIFVTFDKFPENIFIRSKALKLLGSLFFPFFKLVRLMVDANILVGSDMVDATYHNPHVVQNWATCSINRENNSNSPRPNLLYFGNLGVFQAIPLLIDQIKNTSNHEAYQFGFFGSGQYQSEVQSLSLQVDQISYGGVVPMEEASSIYSDYSISVVTLLPEMEGKCVPSKVYNALANGHPILAFVGVDSEVALMIRRYNCGWVLDIKSTNSLRDFLGNFTVNEFNEKRAGVKSIPSNVLSGEIAVEKYLKIINSCFFGLHK